MRNLRLKEHLIDDGDAESELPVTTTEDEDADTDTGVDADADAELERAVARLGLGCPCETPAEDAMRRGIVVGYRIVVAISVFSCAVARWFFHAVSLELLFAISIIQGPFSIYQQLRLIKMRSKREEIASKWDEVKALDISREVTEAEIAAMQRNIERLRSNLKRYEPFTEGYDIPYIADQRRHEDHSVTDLLHENNNIINETKLLAEAKALETLTEAILRTDANKDHYVGDTELGRLALRVEGIVGMPFTGDEMRTRFGAEERRTLRQLADTVLTLYIEKRREQAVAKAAGESARSPRHIGEHLLWKKRIDCIKIGV